MKLKLFATCILSLLITAAVSAQSYTFRVIGTKGNNTVDGRPLKVGMILTDNQTVMIANNGSYLGLMHKTGKTLELQNKGTHQVKSLVSKIKGSGSLNSRYAKFVSDELSQDGGTSAARARAQHMKKTGSTERGIGLVKVMLPRNSELYGSTVALSWYLKDTPEIKPEDVKEYKIYVTDMEDEVLHTQATTETYAFIDLSESKFTEAEQLIFKITPVKMDGALAESLTTLDGYMLQLLDGESKAEYAEELKEVTEGNDNSAISKLVEARFYEENEFYSDAIRTYKQVLELSNNAESYQNLYRNFLIRNGLDKKTLEAEAKAEGK